MNINTPVGVTDWPCVKLQSVQHFSWM